MKVIQHIPTYVDGDRQSAEVTSTQELKTLCFIAEWSSLPGFYRFSIERDFIPENHSHLLMAEFKNGERFYVAARLQGKDLEAFQDLPDWMVAQGQPQEIG
jgi:hypothetical protein